MTDDAEIERELEMLRHWSNRFAPVRRSVAALPGTHAAKISTSTAACRLDRGDVDLLHLHHRLERALGGGGIGVGDRFRQGDRRDLPGQAPFVLAPAARALLAAVADDRVPVAIRFGLVGGGDLERERFVVLERRSAVEPEAGNAHHGELDGQHVPFLPRRESLPARGAPRRRTNRERSWRKTAPRPRRRRRTKGKSCSSLALPCHFSI